MKKRILALGMTLALVVGLASTSLAASAGGALPPDGSGSVKIRNDQYRTVAQDVDNGLGNANESGKGVTTNDGSKVGDVIKSDNMKNTPGSAAGVQRTHGEYQNNTNSCASCHQTHTAASRQLLFKQGIYNTCTACHDGTLGFYNVFANNTANDTSKASSAGTFGGTFAGNASMHMPDDTFKIKDAPGGNGNPTIQESWSNEFNCASCHAPHGAYSDRLLHFNPNHMGATPIAKGGQQITGVIITDSFAADVTVAVDQPAPAMDGPFVAYKTVANDPAVYINTAIPGATAINTQLAAKYTDLASNSTIVVLMKKVVKSTNQTTGAKTYGYVFDSNPWLYGYDFDAAHVNKTYWTNFTLSDNKANNDKNIKYQRAYYAPDATDLAKLVTGKPAQVGKAYVVKLGGQVSKKVNGVTTVLDMNQIPVANANGFTVTKINSDVYDESTYGVAIGKYCAACHTDYLAATADQTDGDGVGVWSQAFRHTTNNDGYTCLKCHYAHGTDLYVLKDAQDKMVADLVTGGAIVTEAEAYIMDKNPSSALKRYTNMAVCWKCHTTSHSEQFVNDDKFLNSTNKPNTSNNW